MDEPVPVRRAAVGCLVIALAGLAFALLIRPAIFSFAPPRDDAAVVVATAAEATSGPIQRDVVLTRPYGWAGERAADGGRVQLRVIVAPIRFGGLAAVAAVSPGAGGCPLEIGDDQLTDCTGRSWSFEGAPIEPADAPALDRFPVEVASGSIQVDFTRTVDPAAAP